MKFDFYLPYCLSKSQFNILFDKADLIVEAEYRRGDTACGFYEIIAAMLHFSWNSFQHLFKYIFIH